MPAVEEVEWDSDSDSVPSGDSEVREINGEVGVPFVPRIVRDLAAADGEINTSLENGVLRSVAVNSDPCRCSASSARGGNDERAGDGGEGLSRRGALQNGARPVGAV